MRSMRGSVQKLQKQLRGIAAKVIRRVARRSGFEVVRLDSMPGHESLPEGRTEPFATAEYDVVPKGRYDIVARNYYSPMPNLEQLPDDIWDRSTALGGIELHAERAIKLVESELAPFVAELDVPSDGPRPPGDFFLRNQNYESVDAELLYAMVRARKPKRVLELGSGYTTLLIGAACRRNVEEGTATEHVAYDPYPREQIIGAAPPPPTRFESISATEVPLDTFSELEPDDVLFVDTTHTVKLGSDVNHIVLEVLPALAPGVIVHFHDIFLPWEYPRVWFEEMEYYWAEQYLLQAFLAFNEAFDVILPAQALAREHPDRLKAVVPSFGPGVSPAAFWLARR